MEIVINFAILLFYHPEGKIYLNVWISTQGPPDKNIIKYVNTFT